MQEGNALTRAGIYRTALLRYREAAAAGLDTPLLHYNLGVTYYRLGEYGDAAQEFERTAAAPDDALGALAQYNLGLALRAAGDRAGAESAFRAAEERAPGRSLRRLAEHASLVVAAPPARRGGEDEPRRTAAESPDERIGDLLFSAAARLGQDDNVYRSPAEPYVDFSDPAQPIVTPTVQAASFVPVDILAAYVLRNEADDTDFRFAYELDGDFFATEFANADRIEQRVSIGADIVLGEAEHRRRTVRSAFFLRDHQETDFDPDDGFSRDIDGVDISERFSYQAYGIEGAFDHTLGDWRWGFDMRLERREYLPTPLVENYDHEYYFTTASVEYDFSRAMTLSFGLRRYRRLYDSRLARDLNGDLLTTNDPQRYDYRGVQLGVARQFVAVADARLRFSAPRQDRRVRRLQRLHAGRAAAARQIHAELAILAGGERAGPHLRLPECLCLQRAHGRRARARGIRCGALRRVSDLAKVVVVGRAHRR